MAVHFGHDRPDIHERAGGSADCRPGGCTCRGNQDADLGVIGDARRLGHLRRPAASALTRQRVGRGLKRLRLERRRQMARAAASGKQRQNHNGGGRNDAGSVHNPFIPCGKQAIRAHTSEQGNCFKSYLSAGRAVAGEAPKIVLSNDFPSNHWELACWLSTCEIAASRPSGVIGLVR